MDYNYNAYEILGLDTNATREEVEQRYKQLREKYQKDRFPPGEAGEDASENLQRIEVAYRDILASMEESTQTEDLRQEDDYTEIQQLIKENKLNEAQTSLDNRVSRDAEWHYVQSILFYKRNWFLESRTMFYSSMNYPGPTEVVIMVSEDQAMSCSANSAAIF